MVVNTGTVEERQAKSIELLQRAIGADSHAYRPADKCKDGWTALHRVLNLPVDENTVSLLSDILSGDATLANKKDATGNTPLHVLAVNPNPTSLEIYRSILQVMLDAGADLSIKNGDNDGETAAELARWNNKALFDLMLTMQLASAVRQDEAGYHPAYAANNEKTQANAQEGSDSDDPLLRNTTRAGA